MIKRKSKFSKIKVGLKTKIKFKIKNKDIKNFIKSIGDKNQLHLKKININGKKVYLCHGMFVASLVSRLLGTYFPLKKNLLISINLNFKKPIYSNDLIFIETKVINKSRIFPVITLNISIKKNNNEVINGEAKIKILF